MSRTALRAFSEVPSSTRSFDARGTGSRCVHPPSTRATFRALPTLHPARDTAGYSACESWLNQAGRFRIGALTCGFAGSPNGGNTRTPGMTSPCGCKASSARWDARQTLKLTRATRDASSRNERAKLGAQHEDRTISLGDCTTEDEQRHERTQRASGQRRTRVTAGMSSLTPSRDVPRFGCLRPYGLTYRRTRTNSPPSHALGSYVWDDQNKRPRARCSTRPPDRDASARGRLPGGHCCP